jgi:hypothetical protein
MRRELGWPLTELGHIRLDKQDLPGAETALLEAHDAGWNPQPTLALVRLARGHRTTAAAEIRDALERPHRVPSKEQPPNTDLQRAPLLQAQVEIELAVGDVDRARAAASELENIAERFASKALVAGAALARGRVLVADADDAGAKQSLSEAVRLWSEIGAPHEVATARSVLQSIGAVPVEPIVGGDVFRREGDYWLVVFNGQAVRVRDRKGMHYLARLLAGAGREFHALDLVAAESGGTVPIAGDAGAMLDDHAKAAYRRRLAEIDDDLEQAKAMGDDERAAQADAERDFLVRELSRAVGLSGRDRRAASDSERARVSVTRALRQAIAGIGEQNAALGEHLTRATQTGTYCAYLPDRSSAGWEF